MRALPTMAETVREKNLEARVYALEAVLAKLEPARIASIYDRSREIAGRVHVLLYQLTVMTEVSRWAWNLNDADAMQINRGLMRLLDEPEDWWSAREQREMTIGQFAELAARRGHQ